MTSSLSVLVLLATVGAISASYGYDEDYGYYDSHVYDDYEADYNTVQRIGEEYTKHMGSFAKSYRPKPHKTSVPVVIRKKAQKKKKILTTYSGFFIEGGTAMFGKFKDLHSCQKACEITPTCFAGDFNPWLGKCFFHGNITACASMTAHKAITHFKKVPCDVLGSPRGIIILGAGVTKGIESKGSKSLQDCIKRCTSAGGGVASAAGVIVGENQICCGVNYDFANHKCYLLPCPPNVALLRQFICPAVIATPLNAFSSPTTITITICPAAN